MGTRAVLRKRGSERETKKAPIRTNFQHPAPPNLSLTRYCDFYDFYDFYQAVAASIASASAQSSSPARGWNLDPFTGVNACAPVPVVLQPAADNTTYSVSIFGDSSAANALNAWVKDGQVYVENTAAFTTANPVGLVLTMPADKLASINNKALGGSASLTAVSGFTPSTLTVETVAGAGPTVLGLNNATSSLFINHAASSPLNVTGDVGTINFSTTSGASGAASFNAVADQVSLSVASSAQSVYVGGVLNVAVQGSSLGAVTVSNGTCSLSSGSCTQVPPLAVGTVAAPTFTGASVAQICTCSGGCANPPPPPPSPSPRPPSPSPSPRPPSPTPPPVGSQCSSTGPNNCVGCCQRKLDQYGGYQYWQDSSCYMPTSSCYVPARSPSPKPSPVGGSCATVSPSSYDACCAQNPRDPSCPQSNNGFIGRKMLEKVIWPVPAPNGRDESAPPEIVIPIDIGP